jgi:hypothetical protein
MRRRTRNLKRRRHKTKRGGFPSFFSDASYRLGATYNDLFGRYQSDNPSPLHQPLIK